MPRKTARANPAAAASDTAILTRSLLDWYDRHRRVLPWRALAGTPAKPYGVWLSEIMLQQTTVAAVKPYFARFMALWPRIEDLAAASTEAVMREWAGLGYYARARNLHACAKSVVERHGGRFPETEAELRSLPGVGAYTAAAIAAIAFGEAAAVVDGNVERVVARLFGIETPLPAARPEIGRLTAALVPVDRPGDFAQGTMDLGATLCTPRKPACTICPLAGPCVARARGLQLELPRRAPKVMRPQRFGAAMLLSRPDGAILVRSRPASGLLGGMTEIFGTGWTEAPPEPALLIEMADLGHTYCGQVDHAFTHVTLRLDVYAGRTSRRAAPVGWRWVAASRVDSEAFPNLMIKVLRVAKAPVSAVPAADPNGLELPGVTVAGQKRRRAGRQRP